MKAKPRVLWLHVHYFDAPSKRDLAITEDSGRGRYRTAKRIVAKGVDFEFVRRGNKQPRAVVRVRGVARRRPGGVLEVTRT